MSFALLHDRACALSSDFGAYITRHMPYAEALNTVLSAHPSYAGLMTYLASQAPSGLYPYLFEERTITTPQGAKCRDYLCRVFHASLNTSSQAMQTTRRALHVVHVVSTILKSRLHDGSLEFCDADEQNYINTEEVRLPRGFNGEVYDAPHAQGRTVSKFLWPFYHNDVLSIKAITNTFVINAAGRQTRTLDQETLTALMLCALAHRLSIRQTEPDSAQHGRQPDVLFSFTAPFVNYRSEHTARGVKVILYDGANDPMHSAQCAMEKLFSRHTVDNPDLLFFATILAQGAFSDASKPEVINKTGLDHYVFSPCHLRFEAKTVFTVVGMVIGLKGGAVTPGQGAILYGSKNGLTLHSDPMWTIGEFPSHLTPLLSNGIGPAHDLPDTASLINQYANFEKDTSDDLSDPHGSWHEGSDASMDNVSDIRLASVNFLAHPHPVFAGFSLNEAYFNSGDLCPTAKDATINIYPIHAIDQFSVSYSDYARRSLGKKDHPIAKPLLMSLNRRGVNSRRVSFLLHEMLTRDNPYVALYKTLRNGMICKNSKDYNLCVSLLSLSGAQDAEKRLIQFAQLYPAMFAWLLSHLSSEQSHVLSNLNAHNFSGDLTQKRLENASLTFFYRPYSGSMLSSRPDAYEYQANEYRSSHTLLARCALGVFRDVVRGLPIDETLRVLIATSSGVSPRLVSRQLVKRLTQCRLRAKDYKAVQTLLNSPWDRSLAHVSRFLEIAPDLTLTQCLEAHKVLIAATDIIRRGKKGYKSFGHIACNGANIRALDYRLCKSIFCASEYRDGGYQDDCDTKEVTQEMAQRTADDAIALSQRVLASFTKKTLEHFKRWTCADIFEIVNTFSELSAPSHILYPHPIDMEGSTCMTENFLRVCSEQHLVGDLLALNAIGHERTDVLQNITATVNMFRLYRPRSVAKNPVCDTWPVLCPAKTYAGVTITCINSTQGLKNEGRYMTHCVGGYTQHAWAGEPILSLSSSTTRSTAHLHVQQSVLTDVNGKSILRYELIVSQHRSFHNHQATASHRAALNRFIEERNADQKQLSAFYKEIRRKHKAVEAYKADDNVRQHPEEHGTALALHWPQFSFFMRKKRDCPYPITSVEDFKALYKKRKRKLRMA